MTKITAAEVNKLRKQTGAGMMDCKKALQENDGDFEKAIDYLRKKGQKVAAKRADREATEGYVIGKAENDFAAAIVLSCETDFVAKGDDFVNFGNKVIDAAISNKPSSLEELLGIELDGRKIGDHVTDLMGKIGEKIELKDYQVVISDTVYAYNHMGNKLSTLVGLNKNGDEKFVLAAKEIAMQVAAMNPIAIDRDDVPQDVIEKEKEIGMDQARQEGKPEAMLEKIAIGKLNRFFKDNTLLNQASIRESKKTVAQTLKEVDKDLAVKQFKRLSLS